MPHLVVKRRFSFVILASSSVLTAPDCAGHVLGQRGDRGEERNLQSLGRSLEDESSTGDDPVDLQLETAANEAEFYDIYSGVLKRVETMLSSLVEVPEQAITVLRTFHQNEGFHPNGLHAKGRQRVLTYLYSLIESFDLNIYFGTELGEYFTYFPTEGVYREPGNSGYRPDDPVMQKYWDICVSGDDGSQLNCSMNEGDQYVQCLDDCKLVLCPDQLSQNICQVHDGNSNCVSSDVKWCPNYTIASVGPKLSDNGSTPDIRGFVPVSYHCIDTLGRFSQEPGAVLNWLEPEDQIFTEAGPSLINLNGNCVYSDKSPVSRVIEGPFESCKEHGQEVCNTTYVGVLRTINYDPRLRPWYVRTKNTQVANWSPPYPFHTYGEGSVKHIGITYAEPFYDRETGEEGNTKKIFSGVIAVDYTLQKMSSFLIEDFGGSKDMVVVVCEEAEPYYVVGISTGSNEHLIATAPKHNQGPKIYRSVLASNPSILCTENQDQDDCELVRVPATDIRSGDKLDKLVGRAVRAHAHAGFPRGESITVKENDDFFSEPYTSQSRKYSHAGLNWVILVAAPIERNRSDTLIPGDPSFAVIILVATIGTIACSALLFMWCLNRKKRQVVHGDFRFTCAFVFGCVLLNISSLMSLGENTNGMCMARMWSFGLCFSLTIAPLFAKVFRVFRLLRAARALRRATMTHQQTALVALPVVATELLILTIFTIVDPPKAVEEIVYGSGTPKQCILCKHQGPGFTIVQSTYSCALLALGCVLSFLTRNLDTRYGESKQLLYGMYNVAFSGICFLFLLLFPDVMPSALHTFRAVAILWGTILTCAVFVLPRLFQLESPRRPSIVSASGLASYHPRTMEFQISNSNLTPPRNSDTDPCGRSIEQGIIREIESTNVKKEQSPSVSLPLEQTDDHSLSELTAVP